VISGYEILGVLGSGGMGRVYKARQANLKRLVALKVILAGEHAGPDEVARFREEAEAVARLQHPNIIQIYEVGEQGGHPFFSMELVEGGSLAEHLHGVPMPVQRAAQLVETLARAVHAAHQQGVVHRDLKPANILLAPPAFLADGRGGTAGWVPKITDFGLAKRLDDPAGITRSGAVVGTPRYMAPEQAWGRSRDIGPGVDVYALGAILYELLTGRAPFQGTKMEVLDQVRQTPPVPPRRLEPEIPAGLETICLKCLEKELAKRYASASALAADLRRFLDDKPILARPPGPAGRLLLWSRRNRTPLAVFALLAGAVALTWFGAARWQSYRLEEAGREHEARERQWKEYQEARGKELFERLLTDGPSTWPMPAEEKLVLQNGLHDLQVRRNGARLRGEEAEVAAADLQLKRAEPILRRLQADLVQGEMMGLQFPSVAAVRASADKTKSVNNLRQLSLAMHNYANSRRSLPGHALYGQDDQPLLSWRVALLPYLGQMPLYNKFKLDEPWDGPHNKALLKYMPPTYIPPGENPGGEPYGTYYQVFVGKGGPVGPVFEPGPRYHANLSTGIPDGSSGTLLIVEGGRAVPWTKPEDLVYDPDGPLPKLGGIFGDGFNAAFADGSARFIARGTDEETLRALITRNGGEPVEWTKLK
jgi:hypothetical protein